MGEPPGWQFVAPLWEYEGTAAWFFVSLPIDISDEIADRADGRAAAFGSVRVEVTVGTTQWRTSLFPSTHRGTYVLPMKKAVRRAERLEADEPVRVRLVLLHT